ncbi:MAG TPA: hypothetical protein VGA96_15375 [Fibrella sp.]
MIRFILSLFCFGLLLHDTASQSVSQDSAFVAAASRFAVARHEQLGNDLEHLYNGPEYIGYDRRMAGHAFFPADSLLPGRVAYEGGLFTVPLLYDIVTDKVVVIHPSGYRMTLHSERIGHFSIDNHTFIRLDSTGQSIPGGFYDLVYNGPTQLLVRRTKQIISAPTSPTPWNSGLYGQFEAKTKYYVRRNGNYSQVKNKRTLVAVLADRRKELMTYARKQRLKFRPSPEAAILKLARYYDELTTSL